MAKIDRNIERIRIKKKIGNIFQSISFVDIILLSQKNFSYKSCTRNSFTMSFELGILLLREPEPRVNI